MTVPALLQFSLVHRHRGAAPAGLDAALTMPPPEERYWSEPYDRWVSGGRWARRFARPLDMSVEAASGESGALAAGLRLALTDAGTWLAGEVQDGFGPADLPGVWLSWLTFEVAAAAEPLGPAAATEARASAQALLADLRHWAPAYPGHRLLRLSDDDGWTGTVADLLGRCAAGEAAEALAGLRVPVFDQRMAVVACADTGSGLPRGEALRAWVDVDPPAGMEASRDWTARWLEGRLYDRWADAGVLHGFTHHSAVALRSGAEWLPALWRPRHPLDGPRGAGCYFDMALMVLGQCALETVAGQTSHELPGGAVRISRAAAPLPFGAPQMVVTPVDQGRTMHALWLGRARADLGLPVLPVSKSAEDAPVPRGHESLGGKPLGVLRGAEGEGASGVAHSNFTIFVVPFRYTVGADGGLHDPGSMSFRELDSSGDAGVADSVLWRSEYLTGETRAVFLPPSAPGLAPRPKGAGVTCETRWFELRPPVTVAPGAEDDAGSGDAAEDAGCRSTPAPLTLRWACRQAGNATRVLELPLRARLVLFDFDAARSGTLTGEPLSRHQQASCIGMLMLEVSAAEGMTVDDLLDLNANLRLLRYQYAAQRGELQERRARDEQPGSSATLPCCEIVGKLPRSLSPVAGGSIEVPMWLWIAQQPLVATDGRRLALEDIDFSLYPDNRAFVASHLTLPDGAPWAVAGDGQTPSEPAVDAGAAAWTLWRQLLEVEGTAMPGRGRLSAIEDGWVRERTYWRWADAGANGERLYGYSNFSFVSMCSRLAAPWPAGHFRGIYLDQTLIALYQRAAVFSFGWELSVLTQLWKRESWERAQADYRAFRERFAQFVNLWWYPAFTNQLQGLEMYELVREEFDSADLFDELRVELETTGEYLEGLAAENAAQRVTRLTWIAALVAALGLSLAFLGTNLLIPVQSTPSSGYRLAYAAPPLWVWGVFIAIIVVAVVAVLYFAKVLRGARPRHTRLTAAPGDTSAGRTRRG